MNSKKNSNAIRRYTNTSCYYADNTVNNVNDSYVTNPIKTVNCNAFKMFTNNLEYYKVKYQHKHYDKANEPYKISFDKSRTNAFIKFSDTHDVKVSDAEKLDIEKRVLFALNFMSENAMSLTCKTVRDFILRIDNKFYFNDVDLAGMIRQFKKQHDIKHRTDNECLVFRTRKPTISKGAKKLGKVVTK